MLHDDEAAQAALQRFAAQVRLGFIGMLGLCLVMLVIHG